MKNYRWKVSEDQKENDGDYSATEVTADWWFSWLNYDELSFVARSARERSMLYTRCTRWDLQYKSWYTSSSNRSHIAWLTVIQVNVIKKFTQSVLNDWTSTIQQRTGVHIDYMRMETYEKENDMPSMVVDINELTRWVKRAMLPVVSWHHDSVKR